MSLIQSRYAQGSAQSFGAFVDIGLGGKDALIHISQLSVTPHFRTYLTSVH